MLEAKPHKTLSLTFFLRILIKKALGFFLVFFSFFLLTACHLYESQGHKEFEEIVETKKQALFFPLSFEPLCFVLSEKQAFSPFREELERVFVKKQFYLKFNSLYNEYTLCEKEEDVFSDQGGL